ncbi:MAG TPA: tripartite tricarboxylate transporter TctB family protein, partial [Candidatus Binatus sp.]|nr:tripartite tricarboxylate transporter TctB family protein [Candidatus Binatus sp.]
IKERRQAREKARDSKPVVEEPVVSAKRFGPAAWFTAVTILLLALALWTSRNFGFRAGLFPWVIGTPTLVLAIGQLGRDLYGKKKKKVSDIPEIPETEVAPEDVKRRTISILFWTIGFFLVIWFLGFSYAVPLTMLLYLKFAADESWLMTGLVTFFSWLFYWSLFEKMLNVPFPEGLLITLIKGGQ